MSATGWFAICRTTVFDLGLDPTCLEVLEAFRGHDEGEPEPTADFERLESEVRMMVPKLAHRITDCLDGEIDLDQAEMFARRYQALDKLLRELAERAGEARILRVGAARRMAEILAAPTPRALRVRALVDFYTSHAALLHHRAEQGDTEPPSIEDLATDLSWSESVPGLEHAEIQGQSELGPVHINLLRAVNVRLQALDCRRMARRAGRDFVAQVVHSDATAAISGGFFLYSEPDIEPPSRRTDPVGLLLRDGEVLSPPVFHRATIVQDDDDKVFLRRQGLAGTTITWRDGSQSTIATCNELGRLGTHPAAFNRAWGAHSPDYEGASVSIVGDRVQTLRTGPQPIPLAGFVLALPADEGKRHAHAPGARIGYALPPAPSGHRQHNAVAGGPMLVNDGRVAIDQRAEDFVGTAPPATFSADETFDQNLLPRLAAGLDEQGRLLLVAIDGRNFHRAPGFTLEATARLMQALGCMRAMNLDGGSSKRMVLQGRVLDLPTTELIADDSLDDAPVRPVHSAILLHYRREEEDEEEEAQERSAPAEQEDEPTEPSPAPAAAPDSDGT